MDISADVQSDKIMCTDSEKRVGFWCLFPLVAFALVGFLSAARALKCDDIIKYPSKILLKCIFGF